MARGGRKQKLRRQARAESRSQGPGQKKVKKDPGLPNLAHFKAHAQHEAQKRKRRMEEQVKRQKDNRERGVAERRSLEGLQCDAQRRQWQFEQKESKLEEIRATLNLENETSCKTYYREFRKVVELSDVVLEVLDCRDPLGCRSPQVEQAVLGSGASKRIVLVLNKIDLVAKDIVQKWLKYLRNELPTVAFKASTQLQNRNLHRSQVPVERAGSELLQSSACVGADNLMRLLGSYCRNRGLKTAITVGVVGFPNVGKSSVINSLKRSRACNVGATPGVTKCLQEIHLDKHVKLLDCPGIVMASSGTDTAIVLRNCTKIEQLDDPVEPVAAILRRCDKEQVKRHYGIGDFSDALHFLALLARRMGGLKKGGVPDHQRAARAVLSDWTSGRICYFTHPPETHTLPTHISAEIVPELGKAFDIEQLEEGNLRCLSEMESPASDSSPIMDTEMKEGNASGQKLPTHGSQRHIGDPSTALHVQATREELMTVLLEERGCKTPQEPERVGGSVPADLKAVRDVEPLLQGQALRAASRRRRRLQKRADKLATKLSVSLTSALDFSLRD